MSSLTLEQQNLQFIHHLDEIYQHETQILADPHLYYFHLESWYVGASPVGRYDAYLGDLLTLWQTDHFWLNTQPKVTHLIEGWSNGRKESRSNPQGLRVFNVAGSALSGTNSALAWEQHTQEFIKFTAPSVFGTLRSLKNHAELRPFKKYEATDIPRRLEALLQRLQHTIR